VLRFVDRDAIEWRAFTGVVCVGRVYKTGGSILEPSNAWTWHLSGDNQFMNSAGRTGTIDEVKAELVKAWKAWVAAAELW
jgi:hypothetical protein